MSIGGKGVRMRFLALLIGLVLIGNAEALASNSPLTVDTQTADPNGSDLFAPRPIDQVPVATPPPPPQLGATTTTTTAAPPVEHITSGNPLWAIPLARLTASRDQPLFAPSRRPAPPLEMVRAAPVPVGPPPKPPEPEKPQLSLLGTVAGSRERIGLFIDSVSKEVLRLKAGENHQGWTLRNVRPRQVELAKGLDNAVLDLAPPDLKPGPAAPLLAGSPPAGPLLAAPATVTSASAALSPPAALVNAFKPSGSAQTLTNTAVKRALESARPPGSR
jgi:hypothetical protein